MRWKRNEVARANAGLRDATEASVCWLNALWDTDPPPSGWLAGWMMSELPDGAGPITAAEFDRRLSSTTGVAEYRVAVATFLWLASQEPVPAWLPSRLAMVQKYLEAHDGALPVRAAWLAASAAQSTSSVTRSRMAGTSPRPTAS